MAAKKQVYVPQGVPTKITATSRMSVKLKEDFYTFEAIEERTLPEGDINLDYEWAAIFESVNKVVDAQYSEAVDAVFYEQKKKKTTSKQK